MHRWLKRICSLRAARAEASKQQPIAMHPQLPLAPAPPDVHHMKSQITDPYSLYDLEARHRRERDGVLEMQPEIPVEEP
jgi:hypothetical protein